MSTLSRALRALFAATALVGMLLVASPAMALTAPQVTVGVQPNGYYPGSDVDSDLVGDNEELAATGSLTAATLQGTTVGRGVEEVMDVVNERQ